MYIYKATMYMYMYMLTHPYTIYVHTHTHSRRGIVRRQKELINPLLFEVAHSGNKDLLFKILENGDDVNPIVSHISRSPKSYSVC